MKVQDFMTPGPVCVAPEDMAASAARVLSRYNIGSVPVCAKGGKLCGLLTDRAIVLRCVAVGLPPEKTAVADIMTPRIVAAAPGDDAEEAAQRMALEQVRRLPVVEGGKLVGVLSLGDLTVNDRFRMEASDCLAEICTNLKKR